MAPSSPSIQFHQCLGRGGFGEVYLATIGTGAEAGFVAAKVLQQGLDARGQAVQRLTDEARLLHLLEHPAILEVHDLITVAGRVALITEYLEGQDLEDLLLPPHTLPVAAGLQVMAQVALALQAAYTTMGPHGEPLRLLHRDIKPGNIRVGPDGSVKVLDFGIAKATGVTREAKTQATSLVGSFAYMAPERFRPREGGTPRGDVYSIGAVLFEILSAGRMLYEGYELRELFSLAMMPDERLSVVDRQLASLEVSPDLRDLVRETVGEDPHERPDLVTLATRLEDLVLAAPGRNLQTWATQRRWPPAPSEQGELSRRRLPYRSLGVQRRKRVRRHAAPTPPPVGPQPVVRSPPSTSLHDAKTLPLPEDRHAARTLPLLDDPPPRAVPDLMAASITPAEPPPRVASSGGSGRVVGGLLLLVMSAAVVGVAVVAGVVGATAWRERAVARTGTADEPVVPTIPTLPAQPVARPRTQRPSPPPPRPDPPLTGPTPRTPTPTPVPSVLPPPDVPAACRDLVDLTERAGALTEAERSCLGEAMRDSAQGADRIFYGHALLDDAWARCEAGAGCADYERDISTFLGAVSQSDQRRMLRYAGHLLHTHRGDADRLRLAVKWAGLALEKEASTQGHATLARASRELAAATGDAGLQEQAVGHARRWATHVRQRGGDPSEAIVLCLAGGGDAGTCTSD